tara:strand:+ start:2415 stop:3191 length:777 start_codon:yes stop_codon:yes gene_type:complete
MKEDKILERERYDSRANDLLSRNIFKDKSFENLHSAFKKPYLKYYKIIDLYIKSGMNVLEIGSGFGEHTEVLLKKGCNLTISDISLECLKLLRERFNNIYDNINYIEADIENLPFKKNEFDVICCAGVLSYGQSDLVFSEIKRVLKTNGRLICVDSLNHNIIYKLNRYLNYKKGKRTLSTIKNMPDLGKIEKLKKDMTLESVNYYGPFIWLNQIMRIFFSERSIMKIDNFFDNISFLQKYAFKFVIHLQKKELKITNK